MGTADEDPSVSISHVSRYRFVLSLALLSRLSINKYPYRVPSNQVPSFGRVDQSGAVHKPDLRPVVHPVLVRGEEVRHPRCHVILPCQACTHLHPLHWPDCLVALKEGSDVASHQTGIGARAVCQHKRERWLSLPALETTPLTDGGAAALQQRRPLGRYISTGGGYWVYLPGRHLQHPRMRVPGPGGVVLYQVPSCGSNQTVALVRPSLSRIGISVRLDHAAVQRPPC